MLKYLSNIATAHKSRNELDVTVKAVMDKLCLGFWKFYKGFYFVVFALFFVCVCACGETENIVNPYFLCYEVCMI